MSRRAVVLTILLVPITISACVLVGAFAYIFLGNRSVMGVTSGSMVPTLNAGDFVLVQMGIDAGTINAQYETGDIIVFQKPGDVEELIVHRAVEKEPRGFTTKGDHNPSPDWWTVLEDNIVGKVVEVNSLPILVYIMFPVLVVVLVVLIGSFFLAFVSLRPSRNP